MKPPITHIGFSDESHWNVGRFRSLGLVTAPFVFLQNLTSSLRSLLEESEVSEFKWKDLRGAKERFAGEKMCRFAVDQACAGRIRVDVVTWDIQDSRHSVPGRDDIANLQRMYYHLFRNVLGARWPNDAVWRLHPDDHTAMEWSTVKDCLENVSERIEVECSLFTEGHFRLRLQREFGLREILPVQSTQQPLLQLADLFAGMAVFSRDQFKEYQAWLETNSKQSRLFADSPSPSDPSRSARERFAVLRCFDELSKQRKLGVSLKTKRGLRTPNPKNPLDFWMYEPQRPEDKAPTKKWT